MTEADLVSLTRGVLAAAFVLALALGAIAQRTHFCTMGAVSDVLNIGDWARARMWVLAIGVAMLGFAAMATLGWVKAADTVYAPARLAWLSHVLGGVLFGMGMVLASGCGNKSLVRLGAGNLKSLVVVLVMGVTALVTLRGVLAVARVNLLDSVVIHLPAGQDLPSLLAAPLGLPVSTLAGVLGGTLGLALVGWVLARAEGRSADVLLGGAGIGLLVVGLWWVSARLGHVAEHPVTLEAVYLATNSQRAESFSFVALDWLMMFSDSSKRLSIGIVAAAGVVLGSTGMALASGTFRWEGFGGVDDTANHVLGAGLMGAGGVTAMGCTVGQGITGLSTLALGSALAVAGIVTGAVLALRWQRWRIERSL